MKIDSLTLKELAKQQSARTGSREEKPGEKKPRDTDKTLVNKAIRPEELDILNYDRQGRVRIDPTKKQHIVDFFH